MLSVVIPAYNEEPAIPQTVRRAKAVLEEAGLTPYEIIIVDDASTDDTAAKAEAEGARVVRHVQNFGYGRSLKDGIDAARFPAVAISDADGTYPLEALPALFELHRKGFDMAVGQRTGEHFRESAVKAPLRRFLRFLVEFAAGQSIPDINSGLRVFSRDTIREYFPHLCNTFSFTTSATLAYMMTGRSVTYLPIDYHKRIGKTKVRLLKDSLRTLHYIVQSILYYDPIKIFLLLSGFAGSIAVISLLIGLVLQIQSGFMLAVGAILVSILVFSMGLLADLLTQIMRK